MSDSIIANLVVLLLFFSGIIMLVLSFVAFGRRSSPIALAFALTALFASIWNFGFAAEIISPTLEGKIAWANFQFLGINFLPVSWLAMTLYSTGRSRNNIPIIGALLIVPIIDLISLLTNNYHHLYRIAPMINTDGVPFPVLNNNYGPLFYVFHAPYGYLLFGASLFLLIYSLKRTPSIYKKQRITLICTLILPIVVDGLYVAGYSPIPAFNFASIAFSLSGMFLSINVIYLRFLDVVPLAYETTINEMNVGVIVLDAPGRVSYINPAAETITGVENNMAVGLEAALLFEQFKPLWIADDQVVDIVIPCSEQEKTFQVQLTKIRKNPRRTAGYVITLTDISERVKLFAQIEELSLTDPLTGAMNRRALIQFGEKEILAANRYHRKLSLIMLDVDNFKQINDQYGHLIGDEVLKVMVHTIKSIIRVNDMLFRYGGDEFVVFLIETNLDDAKIIADRICKDLENLSIPLKADASPEIFISQGIVANFADESLDNLLSRADRALYEAKISGKNQIVVAETPTSDQ